MVDEKEIKGIVEECIEKVVEDFEACPYMFYTEQDIHCYLYSLLLNEKVFKEAYSMNGKKTLLVHKEYPTTKIYVRDDEGNLNGLTKERYEKQNKRGARGKFDIAIFKPDDVNIFNFKDKDKTENPVKPFIAIELALDYDEKHLENNLEKLKENGVKHGYILHFMRDRNLSKKKYNALKEKIEEIRNEGKIEIYYIKIDQCVKC